MTEVGCGVSVMGEQPEKELRPFLFSLGRSGRHTSHNGAEMLFVTSDNSKR